VGAVGIEDAAYLEIAAIFAAVFIDIGFGTPLALVVTTAFAHGIHIPVIGLGLGVDERVAVDFGGGSQEKLGAPFDGEVEHVPRADDIHVEGFEGIFLVLGGRGDGG